MRFFQKVTGLRQRAKSRPVQLGEVAEELPKPRPQASAGIPAPSDAMPAPQATPADPNDRRRVAGPGKTRLIGFDTSDGRLDLFAEEEKVTAGGNIFKPVGILMVTDGPGRGHGFALQAGMSTIGRNDDQTVSLDFGDQAISRDNHAAVVYDSKTHEFLLGHGGKANIVRLNGKPIITTEKMVDGSEIQIGETMMRFVALCDDTFNWNEEEAEAEGETSNDVAFI